jgi:hypothetical protein
VTVKRKIKDWIKAKSEPEKLQIKDWMSQICAWKGQRKDWIRAKSVPVKEQRKD